MKKLTNEKWKNEKNEMKKFAGDIIILHMCTQKNHNHIWCIVPEIWSATDRIFCHHGPFFALLLPYGPRKSKFWKNEKTLEDIIILQMFTIDDSHMIYGFSDMECNRQIFLSNWTVFCPFTPPNNSKNQNFEKLKKAPGAIIILNKCTKNHDHMLYCYAI